MKSVLEEFVPSAADAIEIVKGRVVLIDGTLTPCWSYEEHQELWKASVRSFPARPSSPAIHDRTLDHLPVAADATIRLTAGRSSGVT